MKRGSGSLASPKSSLIQAAFASWDSWSRAWQSRDRERERANREQERANRQRRRANKHRKRADRLEDGVTKGSPSMVEKIGTKAAREDHLLGDRAFLLRLSSE